MDNPCNFEYKRQIFTNTTNKKGHLFFQVAFLFGGAGGN